MRINFYKDSQEAVFGVRYHKNVHVEGQHSFVFSFWKWDLEFEW